MKKPLWKYMTNIALVLCFLSYVLMLYYLTIGKVPSGVSSGISLSDRIKFNANLVPFKTIEIYIREILKGSYITSIAVINLIGNVILTIPLAIFIPYFVKELRRFWKVMLCCFFIICSIEFYQLFAARGSFDVDDIFLNLIGCVIGYIIWKIKFNQRLVRKIQL